MQNHFVPIRVHNSRPPTDTTEPTSVKWSCHHSCGWSRETFWAKLRWEATGKFELFRVFHHTLRAAVLPVFPAAPSLMTSGPPSMLSSQGFADFKDLLVLPESRPWRRLQPAATLYTCDDRWERSLCRKPVFIFYYFCILKFDKRWQIAVWVIVVSKGSIQMLLQNLQETVNVKRKVDPLEPSGAWLQGGSAETWCLMLHPPTCRGAVSMLTGVSHLQYSRLRFHWLHQNNCRWREH